MRLTVDNDLLAVRGTGAPPDYDYTHGTRIEFAWAQAPTRLARTVHASASCSAVADRERGCAMTRIGLAQEIFTPRHDSATHVAGDRPHAALLFASVAIARLRGARWQSLALSAGVTGRPALGEQVQNGVHRLLGNHLERGWSEQLPARLVVAADYDGSVAVAVAGGDLASVSRLVAVTWGATGGTLRRELRAGGRVHYGFGARRPWRATDPLVERPGTMYFDAGYEETLVGHDALIEGDRRTPGAERRPWVGEASAALGFSAGRIGAEYRYVLRGREYRAEGGRHAYGSIALTVRP